MINSLLKPLLVTILQSLVVLTSPTGTQLETPQPSTTYPTPTATAKNTQYRGNIVMAKEIVPDVPVKLTIPAIYLEKPIQPVGLTTALIVDVPSHDIGWYTGSAKPGEKGVVALDGHVSDFSGGPGVFSDLHKLKVGDEIILTDATSHSFFYKVTETELVGVADFPLSRVYGPSDGYQLSIVTCAGTFDRQKGDYDQRTIVYAKLIQ